MNANGAVIERLNDAVWNQGNFAVITELVAEDYVGNSPDGELRGPEGFRAYAELTRRQYPDLTFMGETVAVDGETVVTRWSIVGTYAGHDPNLPESVIGKEMCLSGIGIERVVEGQLVESLDVWDRLGVLQRFGLFD